MVRVKIQLGLSDNADKFVWRYPDIARYSSLLSFVVSTFPGISQASFQIQYKDDEGDLITCSSETDINDALNFANEESMKSLKLFILTADASDAEAEADNDNPEEVASSDSELVSADACTDDVDEPDDDEDEQQDSEDGSAVLVEADAEEEREAEEEEEEEEEDEHSTAEDEDNDDENANANAEEQEDDVEDSDEDQSTPQQPQDEEHEEEVEEVEEEEEKMSLSDAVEAVYEQLVSKERESACDALVLEICKTWPLKASYPIHFGAMLQMMISNESNAALFGFITDADFYPLLADALSRYSGADLQDDIKQMANLYHTVGVDKFRCLSRNILTAFRSKLRTGSAFQLDFGPLLRQSSSALVTPAAASDAAPADSNLKPKAKPKAKRKAKAKGKSSQRRAKAKVKAKAKVIERKRQSEAVSDQVSESGSTMSRSKAKPKRTLSSHGAYIVCSQCDACPIRGARFVCMVRSGYNLCENCESQLLQHNKIAHPMIKVYAPRANWHIKNFKGLTELVAIPDGKPQKVELLKVEAVAVADAVVTTKNKKTKKTKSKKKKTKSEQPAAAAVAAAAQLPSGGISMASIMPTVAQQANATAYSQNQSLMDEIDALLKPSSSSLSSSSTQQQQQQPMARGGYVKPAPQSGLDRLAFAASSNNNNNSSSNIMNNNNNKQMRTASKSDLSGLIDLVNHNRQGQGQGQHQHQHRQPQRQSVSVARPPVGAAYNAMVCDTKHPGDIATNASATMTWTMKNTGHESFGDHCKLAFVSGDGLLVSQYHIPNATPSATVDVTMSFNAFSTPGTYETNFRLSSNGQQFGPHLIVKINVLDPNELMPRPSVHPPVWQQQQQQQQYQLQQHVAVAAPPSPSPPAPAPQVMSQPVQPEPQSHQPVIVQQRTGPTFHEPTSLFAPDDESEQGTKQTKGGGATDKGWFGFGKKKPQVKKESNLSCLCGAGLIYLDVKQAYKGKKVYCDICSKVCKECIFHCPSGDIKAHPGGFDLCYACGGSQLAKQPNPSPSEMFLTSDVAISSAYPALKPSAPPAPSSPNKKSPNYDQEFVYPSQLKQLLDMGFDKEKARRLLLKNRGNMSQVLAELIK